MTVFRDLLDLQTAVVEHVQRPDIVDVMERLVGFAEIGFNRRLRTVDQITTDPVTIANGRAYLPSGLVEIIRVYDGAGYELPGRPLQAIGDGYAIAGGEIRAKQDQELTVEYYGAVPSIVYSPSSSNWLLDKYPALYLYGVGLEAAKYIRDAELSTATAALLEAEYSAITGQDASSRFARARVRVAGVCP